MQIRPIEKEQAAEPARAVYDEMERRVGRVGGFYKMLAHKPDVLRTFNPFYQAIWAPGELSSRLKELAYLRVSIRNGCTYCTRAHTAAGKRQGLTDEQVAALKEPGGRRRDLFSAEEQAVLRFADLLTSFPGNVDQSDIDALASYFNAEQIVELVLTIAAANFTNRVNDGLQTPTT